MSTTALRNTSKTTAKATPDDTPVIDQPRRLVCLEVAWEIDALARLLPAITPRIEGAMDEFLQIRGISARLRSLSSVLMDAFTDDYESIDKLREKLGLNLEG